MSFDLAYLILVSNTLPFFLKKGVCYIKSVLQPKQISLISFQSYCIFFVIVSLQGRFHGPTNHHDEWQKTAEDKVQTKNLDRLEHIKEVADECL